MPEVICLISSSPPPHRPSETPFTAQKSCKPATKAAPKVASKAAVDLTSTPPSQKTKKSYDTNTTAPTRKDGGVSTSRDVEKATSISESKLNEREYVFLDDDFSSEIDLDKEYSLHLSQVRERAKNRIAVPSTTSKVPVKSTTTAITTGYAASIEKPSKKSAPTNKKIQSERTNKDYVFLDDDFSSSIDLDKEYSLSLPAPKKRKVRPEQTGVAEKHGLPELSSLSPGTKQKARPDPNADEDEHSLSDLFGPIQDEAKATKSLSRGAVAKASSTELPAASRTAANEPVAGKGMKRAEKRIFDSDPITFTSSPDFAHLSRDRIKRRDLGRAQPKDLSDIDEPAHKASESLKTATALQTLDSDSDELPELPGIGKTSRALTRTTSDTSYLSRPSASSYPLSRSKSLANLSAATKKRVPRTAEQNAAEAAEKLAAKEAETERKRLLREEKARDKIIAADLAKVNTLKTDKKKSTPEMIVLFPEEMDRKLREQAESFLSKLGVETKGWAGAGSSPGEIAGSGEVKNVVRWKRKVEAVYNEKEDIWEPVPKRIEMERHILVHLPATEFVELATGEEGVDLDEHVSKLKARWFGYKIIYLIEGLTTWQKKNKNVRNRTFSSAARAQIPAEPSPEPSSSRPSKKRKPAPEYISDDLIEDALLRLQIQHRGSVLIHHTSSLVESAEWISIFTQHISTIPYRQQKMNLDTSFCMESGQVRAGEGKRDTFVKMLCEMRGVTAPVGWGIESEIGGGVSALIEIFKKDGKEALAKVRKSANKDGAFTDRIVGKSISKRVYSVFMGTDPWSTDV